MKIFDGVSVLDDEDAELQADLYVLSTKRAQQWTVEQAMEVPQVQYIDKVIDVPVVAQREIPMVQTVQKTTELQCIGKVVDDPVVQAGRPCSENR